VRICVCGDQGTGKTSLVTFLIKDTFISGKLVPTLPNIHFPSNMSIMPSHSGSGGPEPLPTYTTVVADTSALPQDRETLKMELRKANVIMLVYSDHYTYERVGLFWMPYFRTLGLNVPVVLVASKSDLGPPVGDRQFLDEMLAVMNEFKEIDSCIRASAKSHYNVIEAFHLCQRAVRHPIGPLFDSREGALKPAAIAALQRVFYLCDQDRDGFWSDREVRDFQNRCFEKDLAPDNLEQTKEMIRKEDPYGVTTHGITRDGFLTLCKLFAVKGRHETIWYILRKFHYTDSLTLKESFIHTKFDVPPFASAELSPLGYRFFVDLFLLHDRDNDGGLNDSELAALFAPTPGLPSSWIESDFPSCTVRNEAGHITLQGWLAQWSMTTFEEPRTTLEYLAHLGFETTERAGTAAALRVTKPRRNRRRLGLRVERSVFLCYVLGGSGSGKSSLLSAFLNRPFTSAWTPTLGTRSAVNAVELPGGKQCYLILKELGGPVEEAVLDNPARLEACDLLCYTYDSSDPDSYSHLVASRSRHPSLAEAVPGVTVALKADLDKAMQRGVDAQPDEDAMARGTQAPLHVSVTRRSISELFAHVSFHRLIH
jgi:Ras family protein T1